MKLLLIAAMIFTGMACKKKEVNETVKPASVMNVSAVAVYAGRNRVKITWRLPASDISKCRVYWNNGSDSMGLPVAPSAATDSLIVDGLEEGAYTFFVAALDAAGHSSEKTGASGNVYGKSYADSLKNRPIQNFTYDGEKRSLEIRWNDAGTGAVGSEVKYNGPAGSAHTLFVPAFYSNTALEDYDPDGADSLVIYRTLYLPELKAIDTFYTKYDTVHMPSSQPEGDYTMAALQADGAGNTYELINSVLGGNAEETPDCAHPDFGRHITEEYNDELKENVFAFFLHVTPDNDRCEKFDRQRDEIKTYGPSPDSLKAFNGDVMIFTWKFKLDAGFQPSRSFTHIHQIKAGDGPNAGSPLITITPRYNSPDQLEIIHNGDNSGSTQGKVKTVDLAPFKGIWIKATEKITFGTHGTYALTLQKVSDGSVLLDYSNDDIDLWRTGATFIRPKWGIYRSLNDAGHLRDEKVLFADFTIGKKK